MWVGTTLGEIVAVEASGTLLRRLDRRSGGRAGIRAPNAAPGDGRGFSLKPLYLVPFTWLTTTYSSILALTPEIWPRFGGWGWARRATYWTTIALKPAPLLGLRFYE